MRPSKCLPSTRESWKSAVDIAELSTCGLFMSAPVNYYWWDKQHSPCSWTGWFTLPPTRTRACKKWTHVHWNTISHKQIEHSKNIILYNRRNAPSTTDSSYRITGNNLTNKLTPWFTNLLEKLKFAQLTKKFPTFYKPQRFIAVFSTASQLSLSSFIKIDITPPIIFV